MKKLLSCIVACAMMISILGINAYAAEREIQSEAPMITEEVAQIIASYFLRDYQDEAGCCWDTNTAIVNSVIMYNLEEEISAYSFELATSGVESGYIVVSAYTDVENVILEFSDTATPVYEPFNLSVGEKIIYTGGLNYFKESVDGTFFAVNGKTLQKNQIETPLESIRSEKYLPASFRDYEYPIKDPIAWANKYYGGPFYAKSWKNSFEDYCEFWRTSDFKTVNGTTYSSHCGPTAITNLIRMVGKYRNHSKVTSTSGKAIFKTVADYGKSKGYYTSKGTPHATTATYIKDSFQKYGISTSVKKNVAYSGTIVNAINAYKPIYLTVTGHSYYGTHAVAAYAYTQLVSEKTGSAKIFVKIADGFEKTGRYLCADILSSENMYVITIGNLS